MRFKKLIHTLYCCCFLAAFGFCRCFCYRVSFSGIS